MEDKKGTGGIFGAVLVVVIVVGALVYFLAKNKNESIPQDATNTQNSTVQSSSTSTGANTNVQSDTTLENDLNDFDSNTDDVTTSSVSL